VSAAVYILYEDSRAGDRPEYGPHDLVVQCVCDRLGCMPWQLRPKLEARPLNSNSKVREHCRGRLFDRLVCSGGVVVAVYDDDKIRHIVNLPRALVNICKQQIVPELKKDCPRPGLLQVVLLHRNIETLIGVVADLAPAGKFPEHILALAIEKKDRNQRDRILKFAAGHERRHIREEILRHMPSFAYLVEKIAGYYSPR
jgi:hypothetical protein